MKAGVEERTARTSWQQAGAGFLIVGIILIAMNLRAPFISVGPLIGLIRESLGLSSAMSGMLTTLPLLAFAVLSPVAPRLARRYGLSNVLGAALLLLTIGIGVRWLGGVIPLFTGTILIGAAIAICNVLLPSLIKKRFPGKIGLMTGIYSVSMNISASLAAGISVPLAMLLAQGWSGSLAIWLCTAGAALLLWVPQLQRTKSPVVQISTARSAGMWASPLAWQITIFMGLQSILYYVFVAWFPDMMAVRGISSSAAGWMMSLMQLSQLPLTFLVPIWAGRMKNQLPLVFMMSLLYISGLGGLWLGGNEWILFSVICIGIAGGSSFGLVLMFFTLRTRTAQEAAEISGMAQSVGYVLAAAGPVLFGYLHDMTENWSVPLILLICFSLCLLMVGIGAGKNRYIR